MWTEVAPQPWSNLSPRPSQPGPSGILEPAAQVAAWLSALFLAYLALVPLTWGQRSSGEVRGKVHTHTHTHTLVCTHTHTEEDSFLGVEVGVDVCILALAIEPITLTGQRAERGGMLRLLSAPHPSTSSLPTSVMGQGPGKDISFPS